MLLEKYFIENDSPKWAHKLLDWIGRLHSTNKESYDKKLFWLYNSLINFQEVCTNKRVTYNLLIRRHKR